jgi:pimeloyl-ACP methyl ester carboxylesterase
LDESITGNLGIVFLESSHPRDVHLDEYQGKVIKAINKMFSMLDSLSSHKRFNEVHFVKKTVDHIRTLDRFPEIPVYVITGGKENRTMPEEARKKRLEHQSDLLFLSKCSKHIIAEKSGHFPQLSEPGVVFAPVPFLKIRKPPRFRAATLGCLVLAPLPL